MCNTFIIFVVLRSVLPDFMISFCLCVFKPSFHLSGQRTHVRESSWTEHVRRGQSHMVHLWARYRGRHARGLFRGEHLRKAEHDTRHCQRLPSHHCHCFHAAKLRLVTLLDIHTHSQSCTSHTTSCSLTHCQGSSTLQILFDKKICSPPTSLDNLNCFPETCFTRHLTIGNVVYTLSGNTPQSSSGNVKTRNSIL